MDLPQLLAAFWLYADPADSSPAVQQLKRIVAQRGLSVTTDIVSDALRHVNGGFAGGNVHDWVVTLNFFGSFPANWNFLIDTVSMAQTDAHLAKITKGPFDQCWAKHRATSEHCRARAPQSDGLARIIVSASRHTMGDEVWANLQRLRANLEADILPLPEDALQAALGARIKSERNVLGRLKRQAKAKRAKA